MSSKRSFFVQDPRGKCKKCICSSNIDQSAAGNCNTSTGECLRCLFNTVGESCEFCRAGYFGDALDRSCKGEYPNISLRLK